MRPVRSEPHMARADGSSGVGDAVWCAGLGVMSLVENEYIKSSTGIGSA
jgi:hypothetical protein